MHLTCTGMPKEKVDIALRVSFLSCIGFYILCNGLRHASHHERVLRVPLLSYQPHDGVRTASQ